MWDVGGVTSKGGRSKSERIDGRMREEGEWMWEEEDGMKEEGEWKEGE